MREQRFIPEYIAPRKRVRQAAFSLIVAIIGLVALLSIDHGRSAAAEAPSPAVAPVSASVSATRPAEPVAPVDTVPPVDPIAPVDTIAPPDSTPIDTVPIDSGSTATTVADPTKPVEVKLPDVTNPTPNSVLIILLITVISLVPSLLVLCTAFTRIVIVLSLTRNALGIPQLPPQQVIVGLSLFLTIFVMGPTFKTINNEALQPLLKGKITTSEAFDTAQVPLREFMMAHTGDSELKLFVDASGEKKPVARDKISLTVLIPAFVISELKTGFIIGFCIFVPFLIIDLVVSAVLMALGMMMLPPSFVSLPFKLLLFVMLDGWALVVGTLLRSYR
jgi:flagellar biosynthetic protein FliP